MTTGLSQLVLNGRLPLVIDTIASTRKRQRARLRNRLVYIVIFSYCSPVRSSVDAIGSVSVSKKIS
jgi:hypothetical protein